MFCPTAYEVVDEGEVVRSKSLCGTEAGYPD